MDANELPRRKEEWRRTPRREVPPLADWVKILLVGLGLVVCWWFWWANLKESRVEIDLDEPIIYWVAYRWYGSDYYLIEWRAGDELTLEGRGWFAKPEYRRYPWRHARFDGDWRPLFLGPDYYAP